MTNAPLEFVAYVSSATGILGDNTLEGLLTSAWQRNKEHQVTGVLLFDEGTFFQYFEGPPVGVEEVYGHIKRSTLHTGIIELQRTGLARREFPRWLMGFTRMPGSSILRLSNASWRAALRGIQREAPKTEGMELLKNFWRASQRMQDPGG